MALRRWQPWWTGNRRTSRKITLDVISCVRRFDGKLAASETDPKRGVGISAGQGWASRGLGAPARYPRMRTGRGRGVSTESRGLRCPAIM